MTFRLPAEHLERNKAIPYQIAASAPGVQCDSGVQPLYLIISEETPSSALELEPSVRSDFVKAAITSFLYTAGRKGVKPSAENDILSFCQTAFSSPTPCEWAPGESH